MTDATPILLVDPCRAFVKASAQGYSFWYEREDRELRVRVMHEGKEVAHAEPKISLCGTMALCDDIDVITGHKRRGLGTSMYVLAERVLGVVLENAWDRNDHSWPGRKQSEEAAALWAQPNRPFGKRQK